MRVIGIDPGAKGGLVELTIYRGGAPQLATRALVMPWYETGKAANSLAIDQIVGFIGPASGDLGLVAIESQQMMGGFGGGAVSAFGTARLIAGYHELLGMCKALGYPYVAFGPKTWQAALLGKPKLPPYAKPAKPKKPTAAETRARKSVQMARRKALENALRDWVRRRYPGAAGALTPGKCRVPHEGLVAALAIAHHGMLTLQGERLDYETTMPKIIVAEGAA